MRGLWLPELCPVNRARAPFHLLGALPIQEEVAMEAALTFVPIAIILAVHTHSLVFTRTFCHPVFNLAKERQGDHKEAWTRHLLPQTQGFGLQPLSPPPDPVRTSLAPSWPFRAPSWTHRRGCCLDRRSGRAGRSRPPQRSPRTAGGTAHSGCPGGQIGCQRGWRTTGPRQRGDRLWEHHGRAAGLALGLGNPSPPVISPSAFTCTPPVVAGAGGPLFPSPKC